jgi:hypothetical protein
MDSYFTLAPNQYTVQEADGTPVSLGNWDSQTRILRPTATRIVSLLPA